MIRKRQKQQKQPRKTLSEPTQQTFLDHVYELRRRVFWIFLTLVVASAASFQYKDLLISVVMAPLHGEKLVYLTPTGGFSFIFTLSIYVGLLFTIPVIIYHVYKFLQPLVARTSRRFVAAMILFSIILATAGASFGYFVTIPGAIGFLTTFAGDVVTPNLTADSYLNFVVAYVVGLAALFQLPLLLFLFDHVRPIPPGMLSSTQRFVIIGATILAAVITPTPDAVNMMIVAIPIIVVYEIGAFAVFIRHRIIRSGQVQSAKAPKQPNPEVKDIDHVVAGVVAEAKPLPATVTAQRRTVDGILLPPRQSRLPVTVPLRSDDLSKRSLERQPVARPMRSLDGVFPA